MTTRRGNVAWLIAMFVAMIALLSAGALPVMAGVVVLTAVLFAYGAISGDYSPGEMRDRMLDSIPFNRPAITDSARRARMQASRRADFDLSNYALKDVGIVVEEPRRDGLHLREARLLSMDDEAVRPYIIIHAPRQDHPRETLIRYEITDAGGQQQFVCEIDHWMRPGENTVLPNYRLPLRGNESLDRMGTWDLQVWVNGGLVAIHEFSVSPSMAERRKQFGLDGEAQEPVRLERDASPVSLDDILSSQRSRTSRSG